MAWILRFLAPLLGKIAPFVGSYGKLAGMGVLAAALFVAGYKVADWRASATLLGVVEAGAEHYRQEAQRADRLAKELEVERDRQKIVYRDVVKEVTRVVERPVYRSECIDDDGLRLANRALDGATAPAR